MSLPPFPDCPPDPAIVAEGPDWLVVRKPAFMPSVGLGEHGERDTLAAWLERELPSLATAGRVGEAGLLQRLDTGTSGLLLVARDAEAWGFFREAAEAGRFSKSYLFVCAPAESGLAGSRPLRLNPPGFEPGRGPGVSPGGAGVLELGSRFRAFGPGARRVACLAPDEAPGPKPGVWTGAVYRTALEALERADSGGFLGLASLDRGFRHQVRAHLAWLGLPLDGDTVYGGRAAGRLMLHACSLEFPLPGGGNLRVLDPVVAWPARIV